MIARPAWMLAAAAGLAALGLWFFSDGAADRAPNVQPLPQAASASRPTPAACAEDGAYQRAAARNRASLTGLAWSPFGRLETGWRIYAPFVAFETGTACDPGDSGFAWSLADWQRRHERPATGVFTPEDFEVMRVASHLRRPFVRAFRDGCPQAADPTTLTAARPDEGYSGKAVTLRSDVLDAYRRMVAAARAEVSEVGADPAWLAIVSGYRGPAEEAARCAGRDCTGPARAACSPHRTGTAIDLFVGAAPGSGPASTDDANRLFQSRTAAYRWLVANGARFGFAPYVFEPWHWEYVAAPAP